MAIKAAPLSLLDPPWASTPINGSNPLLVRRGFDAGAAHAHVQDVGINASLYHRWRQDDRLGSKDLNQRLVDDPPAMIAASGTRTGKVLRLIDIYPDVYASPLGISSRK